MFGIAPVSGSAFHLCSTILAGGSRIVRVEIDLHALARNAASGTQGDQMQKAWFGLAVIALLLATWGGYVAFELERHQWQWSESGGYMWVDRWNGNVEVCTKSRCVELAK